jgi:AcrR family transcriptional regulator
MKSDERKKQIIDAALSAFAEHGYERTSIAIICEKAGIARPTLYQYFKDKRSVFRELLESSLQGIHERIHAWQATKDKGTHNSRGETLYSLHLGLLNEASLNRDLFAILSREAKARNAETEDIVRGMYRAMVKEFVDEMQSEPVAQGVETGMLEFTAVYMLGGTMQAIEYFLFDAERRMAPEKLATYMTMIESRIAGLDVHYGIEPAE